jgi:hypothetical protein
MLLTDKEMSDLELAARSFCSKMVEMGCDSVRIICTAGAKGGNTHTLSTGYGNFFAQLGSVDNWVREMKNIDMVDGISEAVNTRPPESGEDWKE